MIKHQSNHIVANAPGMSGAHGFRRFAAKSLSLARQGAAYVAMGLALVLQPLAAQSQTLTPIRIGWIPDPNVGLYMAWQKNYFEKHGLKPEFIKFISGPTMFSALESGSVDVVDVGLGAAVVGKAQGIDLKLIAVAVDVSPSNVLVAQADFPVGSPKDLRGKRVGSTKGSTPYYGLIRYLQSGGMSITDIEFVDLAPPNIIPAFRRKEVDAAWTWSPWQDRLVAAGGKAITNNARVGAHAPEYLGVRGDFLKKNPDAVVRFLAAFDAGLKEAKADREAAAQSLIKLLNVDAATARSMLETNEFPDLAQQANPDYAFSINSRPGAKTGMRKVLEEGADFFHSQGFSKNRITDPTFLDPGPLQSYLRSK